MKKTLLTLVSATGLLGALAAPAYASSTFHLVVPLGARTQVQEPVEAITVSLAGAALPKARLSTAYSHSLQDYLAITGDKALDKSAARWRLVDGVLPVGLVLDETTGAVAGIPTAKTTSSASFTVLSAYKGADGQAAYTIEVGGAVLQATKISAGGLHTCAITTGGGAKCWGDNSQGQLGIGSYQQKSLPTDVIGLNSNVADIAAGPSHTCAVTTAGAAYCWGQNTYRQLGNGSNTSTSSLSGVAGLSSGVSSIATGMYHSCAIMKSGELKCWGNNGAGELGDPGSYNYYREYPVTVTGISNVSHVSLGVYFTCAVSNGGAYCWGKNNLGQLGDGTTTTRTLPVSVAGLSSGVTKISAGSAHACAATTSGVNCWGNNNFGQLGDGSTTRSLSPIAVQGLSAGASVDVGGNHSCALNTPGALKCWGYNYYGQLGIAQSGSVSVPTAVVGFDSGVVAVATGENQTCAVLATGNESSCWGRNDYGQVGDNSNLNRNAPVEVYGSN